MLSVCRRLRDTNVYVQVLFIQVHYVKSIRIRVNTCRVKMAFVNCGQIPARSAVFAILATRANSVISRSIIVYHSHVKTMAFVPA
jgi:hypothetical protein